MPDLRSFDAVIVISNDPNVLRSYRGEYYNSYVKYETGMLRNIGDALQSDLEGTRSGDWAVIVLRDLKDDESEQITRIINNGGKVFFPSATWK